MPNDDLGQFPMPSNPTEPSAPAASSVDNTPPSVQETPVPAASTFEETPEEIPAYNPPASVTTPITEAPVPEAPPAPTVFTSPTPVQEPVFPAAPSQAQPNPAQPIPVSIPPKTSSPAGPIIFIVLFLVAVIALAGAAFLYQQTQSLKTQLVDITNTIQKQQTNPVVTPTPSVIEVPSASPTATPTVTITPITSISATPTPTVVYVPGSPLKPLSVAPKILQIAINHSPNAQFILLKTENANDPINATTKYFFRQDLTTKKYFYVLVSGSSQPQVVDKQIYVTPDDNIPSLNDLVLQDNLGIDLDEAINIVNQACSDPNACAAGSAQAQYIKTSSAVIWQISLTLSGKTQPMVMQINAQTKAVIYKTTDFAK